MQDSIFSKIIAGDIPAHKIYEDELTLAFLDINPAAPGHTLVIPKTQVEFMWDLKTVDYEAVMRSVQKVGRRLRDVMGVPYVGQLVVGTDVPHAHVHVIPFTHASEMKRPLDGPGEKVTDDELAALAAKLRF